MDGTNGMRIFISHAQQDADLAKELSRNLEAQGFEVFDPAVEVFPGDDWYQVIGEGLAASQAMVVLISPESARSDAVQGEIEYALGSKRFEGRLIPVEVEPTKDVPWILRRFRWVKVQNDPTEAGYQVGRILKAAGEPKIHAAAH
jgi:hypothetical protein